MCIPQQPSFSQSRLSPTCQQTNTIAITSLAGLPKTCFAPEILDGLRTYFAKYGDINQWVPLPGFGRILVVYKREDDAENAKRNGDFISLGQLLASAEPITLRVYRADPNPLVSDDTPESPASFLQLPKVETSPLSSSPGSPPPPPPATQDLVRALGKLQIQPTRQQSVPEVVVDPREGSGVGVYVVDCDSPVEEEEPWTQCDITNYVISNSAAQWAQPKLRMVL